MINIIDGCCVPYPERLEEEYEVRNNFIAANVSAEHIRPMFLDFVKMHSDEPIFFILEVPTNFNDEPKTEDGYIEKRHKDVYYIDGINSAAAEYILKRYGEMLVHDGMSSFGFGCHESGSEIMLTQYNVVTIFTAYKGIFSDFLEVHGISKTDKLVTAWDTFNINALGECRLYTINGKCIYDLIEELKIFGIYFAERRDD